MKRLFALPITALAIGACTSVIGIDQQAKLDPDASTTTSATESSSFADERGICDPTSCAAFGGECEAWGCSKRDCETTSCQGMAFVCPPGNDCNIECKGSNCDGASCTGGDACRFDCTSADCMNTTCTSATCEFYCNGDSSCTKGAGCPSKATEHCSVECGKSTPNDACHAGFTCCGSACPAGSTCL